MNNNWTSEKLGERIAPRPTIRRLTFYLRVLRRLRDEGQRVVTCTRLKDLLGFDSTQIRKDLSVTGAQGKPKVGYKLDELVRAVERYLGWDSPKSAVMVGVGSLGRALLGYTRFHQMAHLEIVAAFDNSLEIVGTDVYNVTISNVNALRDFVRDNAITLGIITVPEKSAQAVADTLVAAGVEFLWNFAPCTLEVPAGVVIENVDMSISLAMLTTRMANRSNSSNSSAVRGGS